MKSIKVRNYEFDISEFESTNPYNDENGNPILGKVEISYAWSEAAYIFRQQAANHLSTTEDNNVTILI